MTSRAPTSTNGIVIRPYVADAPAYVAPPARVNYWFTSRDRYRTDNISSTDIALNYAFKVPALGESVELFVSPRVTNVLNRHGVINVNSTVYTGGDPGKGLSPFNPFTTTNPVECPQGAPASQCSSMGANWQKGPDFGKPRAATTATTAGDFQLPRTFLLSACIRF